MPNTIQPRLGVCDRHLSGKVRSLMLLPNICSYLVKGQSLLTAFAIDTTVRGHRALSEEYFPFYNVYWLVQCEISGLPGWYFGSSIRRRNELSKRDLVFMLSKETPSLRGDSRELQPQRDKSLNWVQNVAEVASDNCVTEGKWPGQ